MLPCDHPKNTHTGPGTAMKQKQYLDSSVQWSTGKCVIILWVESHLHDVVRVALKDLSTSPAFVPIPELYEHVIRWRKHIWKCGMNRYTADVVSVSLKLLYFIHGVVIVYPDKHIIWTSHDPLLARYEFCWSHWKLIQAAKVSPRNSFTICHLNYRRPLWTPNVHPELSDCCFQTQVKTSNWKYTKTIMCKQNS